MKKIEGQEGLFQMDATTMPYGPNELAVPRYVMPSTYGRCEQEEAAARFIIACQKAGNWCGVSAPHLFDTVRQEYKAFHAVQEAKQRKWSEEQRRYSRQLRLYVMLCILTLGLYALFGKKPIFFVEPQEVTDQTQVPFSGIYIFGPQHVMTGLVELKDKGMLTVERHEDDFDVVFPTPELLGPISRHRRSSLQ